MPFLGLCAGSKYRGLKPGRFLQPFRQFYPANGPCLLIFLPAAAREIAPYYALHRKLLGFLYKHAPAFKLITVFMTLRWVVINLRGNKMVFYNILHLTKPVNRYLCKQSSLSRNPVWKYNIKGRYSVRGYHKKAVFKIIDVP